MNSRQKRFIEAIETCVLQSLDGNKGRSNTKTSILHGAFQDYVSKQHDAITWKHEKRLKEGEQSFNVDMYAVSRNKHIAVLLKAPTRSLNKNKHNTLVNLWGEGIRVSLLGGNYKTPLSVLFVSICPTKDIIVYGKDRHGKGKTRFSDFIEHPPAQYNSGYSLLKPSQTKCKYVGVPYDYKITPTLKNLQAVYTTLKSIESGKRILISKKTWEDLDNAIEWLVEGF